MAYDLSLREKRLIQAAESCVILFLLYLLFLRGGSDAVVPVARTAAAGTPQTAPPPAAAAPRAAARRRPPTFRSLRLHGLLASGAVIGFPTAGSGWSRSGARRCRG